MKLASASSPELKKLDETLSALKTDFAETKKPELQPRITQLTADRKAMVQALLRPETRDGIARLTRNCRPSTRNWSSWASRTWCTRRPISSIRRGRSTSRSSRGRLRCCSAAAWRVRVSRWAPGALSCVTSLPSRFVLKEGDAEGARRAALAHWITGRDNMLTWRSIVNRVWQYHFGAGLVDSPNDFGHMGSPPTHPELLDWLAVTFRDQGGSLKQLHRLIVMSRDLSPAVCEQRGECARWTPRIAICGA